MADDDAIEVPHTALSPSALRAVIEEFVTRAGTDYGVRERSLADKVEDVMRQLTRGEVTIVFDRGQGTVHIAPTARRR